MPSMYLAFAEAAVFLPFSKLATDVEVPWIIELATVSGLRTTTTAIVNAEKATALTAIRAALMSRPACVSSKKAGWRQEAFRQERKSRSNSSQRSEVVTVRLLKSPAQICTMEGFVRIASSVLGFAAWFTCMAFVFVDKLPLPLEALFEKLSTVMASTLTNAVAGALGPVDGWSVAHLPKTMSRFQVCCLMGLVFGVVATAGVRITAHLPTVGGERPTRRSASPASTPTRKRRGSGPSESPRSPSRAASPSPAGRPRRKGTPQRKSSPAPAEVDDGSRVVRKSTSPSPRKRRGRMAARQNL